MEQKKKTNKKFIVIISALVTVGLIYGGYKYFHSLSHEETDDAQVEANMNAIIPHVGGYVQEVLVEDNQKVKKKGTPCSLLITAIIKCNWNRPVRRWPRLKVS